MFPELTCNARFRLEYWVYCSLQFAKTRFSCLSKTDWTLFHCCSTALQIQYYHLPPYYKHYKMALFILTRYLFRQSQLIAQLKECADHQKQCYSPCQLPAQTCLYALYMGYSHQYQISCITAGLCPCQTCRHFRRSGASLCRALQISPLSVMSSLGVFSRVHGPCNWVENLYATQKPRWSIGQKHIAAQLWTFTIDLVLHACKISMWGSETSLQGMVHLSACDRGLP